MSKTITEVGLLDILPASITWDDTIKRCVAAVDASQQDTAGLIPQVLIYSRIAELPSDVIDALAWQFHVDFYRPWLPLAVRRAVVQNALDWHRTKGTPGGLEEAIQVLTKVTATVRERPYFLTDHSLTDQDTLTDPPQPCFLTDFSQTEQDYLGDGSSSPFEFDVRISTSDAVEGGHVRADMENIVEVMRPARSAGTVRFVGFRAECALSLTNVDLL